MRKKKQVAEFRYYKMPENCALFALLGEKWRQKYERDIDYLHFHNYLEIGYCYEGDGRMVLGEEEIQYQGGDFTVIPSNFLHTTNSAPGRLSSWEYLFVDVEKLIEKATAGVPGRMEKLMRRLRRQKEFVLETEDYKRPRAPAPSKLLEPWYRARSFTICHSDRLTDELFSRDIVDRLKQDFTFLLPYYDYFVTLEGDPDPRDAAPV